MESVEAYFNGYLQKWLGVNKNMSNESLYCDETPCPLPIHSLVKQFKKCKVGGLLQFQQSDDQSVKHNVTELYTDKNCEVAVGG